MVAPWRFQNHRDACDLPDHIDFARFKDFRRLVGRRMRLQDYLSAIGRTPAAAIATAMFEEIDGAVELAGPTVGEDFAPPVVDQH